MGSTEATPLLRRRGSKDAALQYAAYSGFLFVSVAIMVGLVIDIWRRRPAPGASEFAIHTMAVAVWALAYAFEIALPGIERKLFFAKLSYLGVAFVPVTFLVSTRRFLGRREPLRPSQIVALCVVPCITLVFAATNGADGGWQWAAIEEVRRAGADVLHVEPGPWYWVSAAYSYALYLTALAGIAIGLTKGPRLLRRQALLLFIASAVPGAANAFYLAGGGSLPDLDFTPFAFGVSTLIFAWNFRRLGLFDLVPVAREILVEEMRDGLVVLDWQGRIVDLNPAAERLLGIQVLRALGQPLEVVLPEAVELARNLRDEPGASRRTLEIARSNGGPTGWYEVAATPLRERGRRLAGDLIVLRDVTERVAAARSLAEARDQALAADRAKSEFLATMSHEIRTPMNGVIGMTDILLDSGLDDDQRECAARVRAAAESLLTILNDILDFSKIEAGKLELEHRVFDLRTTVEEALELVATAAYDKALDVACLFAPRVPDRVIGDPGRTRQILLNLLSNAVKFTARGQVVVRVEPIAEDAGYRWLRFEVSDTGIGIPEEEQAKLFDPFSQVHASSTSPYGGTGLGLAIVKRLVALHGGQVGFESEPGRGSAFWFTLRVGRVVERAPEPAEQEGPGLRVLCVDDSAVCREQLLEQLAEPRLAVDTASDAAEALATLRDAAVEGVPFDLVVLDDDLDAKDPLGLAWRIRESAELGRPSVIILTPPGAALPEGNGGSHGRGGFVARVRKPPRRATLLARIRLLLEDAEQAAAAEPHRLRKSV